MKKIVLTGGPGIGKTTLIELLAAAGYAIVPEAARLVVEDEESRGGDARPWSNPPRFQKLVAEKQLELEAAAEKRGGDLYFLDRGLVDGHAYCKIANIESPALIYGSGKNRYSHVFLLDPLPSYRNDGVRYESEEKGMRIHNEIAAAYREFGYNPISVPILPPEGRMKFILDHIKHQK
jgi:predicted ATPase